MSTNVDGIGFDSLATDDTRQIQYGAQCFLSDCDIEIGWEQILGALHWHVALFFVLHSKSLSFNGVSLWKAYISKGSSEFVLIFVLASTKRKYYNKTKTITKAKKQSRWFIVCDETLLFVRFDIPMESNITFYLFI